MRRRGCARAWGSGRPSGRRFRDFSPASKFLFVGTAPYRRVARGYWRVPIICTEATMSVETSRSTGAKFRDAALRRGAVANTFPKRAPKQAWLVVALLFLFMAINFADKAVIGIAAVPMMHDLKITPSQFGLIGSSFFLLFSVSAIVTGFVVNRVQTRWALLAMGLVWALTQFPMLGTVGFTGLVACRVALGAGEGPAFPVALHS